MTRENPAEARKPGLRRRPSRARALIPAAVNSLADIACLGLSLRAVQPGIPWSHLILAWAAGITAAGLSLTPGGIGMAEAAVAAVLAVSGVPGSVAIAAAVLYRFISFWGVAGTGWIAYYRIRRDSRSGPLRAQGQVPRR